MIEHARPAVGVAVLIRNADKFLMIKRTGAHGEGTWSVPGGHLEYGESIEACAARETLEEVGLNIVPGKTIAVTNDIFDSNSKHYITIWVESIINPGYPTVAEIKEPDKILKLEWYGFSDLPVPLFEPCWQNLRQQNPELFKN